MLEFQCIDWWMTDGFVNATNPSTGEAVKGRNIIIKVFGRTAHGVSVGINLVGFKPYFYIACEDESGVCSDVIDACTVIAKKNVVSTCEIVYKKPFRWWSGETKPYVKLSFDTLSGFKKMTQSIKYGTKAELAILCKAIRMPNIDCYEADVSPELRLFHITGIKPTGWVSFNGVTKNSSVLQMTPKAGYNITTWYTDLEPMPNKTDIAPLIVAAFDIECTSTSRAFPRPINSYASLCDDIVNTWVYCGVGKMNTPDLVRNIRAVFYNPTAVKCFRQVELSSLISKYPQLDMTPIELLLVSYSSVPRIGSISSFRSAVKGALEDIFATMLSEGKIPAVAGDKVFQIGVAVKSLGSTNVDKYLLCLKECDPIHDAVVKWFNTEVELLNGWANLMVEIDPDIITGYNINNFDYMYIIERCTALGICIQNNKWQYNVLKLSKLVEDYEWNNFSKRSQKVKQSAAFGDSVNDIIVAPGRINLDLIKIIQQEHQLDSYKLDDVACKFMSGGIKEILNSTEIVVSSADDIDIGNYMKFSDERRVKVIDKRGDTLVVESTHDMVVGDPWGMVKDDIEVNDIFESYEGTSEQRSVVGKYCVQDCVLVIKIIEKLSIIVNALAMSSVCLVPLDYVYWRGQNIRSYSLICNACEKTEYIVPDVVKSENEEGAFEGAMVLNCIPGVYNTGVIVLDYASLYPSSIITSNVSHETILRPGDLSTASDMGLAVNTVKYDSHLDGEQFCNFIATSSQKGILPSTITSLLKARKDTRKKQKDCVHKSFQWKVLEGLQLAYKVVANSMYGTLGATTSKLAFSELAACVTAIGRTTIMSAIDVIQQRWGGRVVYVDTDSTWVIPAVTSTASFKNKSDMVQACIDTGKYMSEQIGYHLSGVQDLEYEMTVYPLIMFSKKRYLGNIYEDKGSEIKGQKTMGVVLKRRDNAAILKDVYGSVINIILNNASAISTINNEVKCLITKLLDGKFPLRSFVITKKLLAYYQYPQSVPHKVLADRMSDRDPGTAPTPNERMSYVILKTDITGASMGDRIESVSYLYQKYGNGQTLAEFMDKPAPPELNLDYLGYLDTQIQNPLMQILELIMPVEPDDEFLKADVGVTAMDKLIKRLDNWDGLYNRVKHTAETNLHAIY